MSNNGGGTSTGDVGNKIWLGWTSGHDGSASLNGMLDEVCLFNSALSATQITNLYNQTYVNPSYQYQSPSVGFAAIIEPPDSPNFSGINRMKDGPMILSFSGPASGNYSLWAGTNLALPLGSDGWALLKTGSFSGGTISFIDENATNYPARFYRITMP